MRTAIRRSVGAQQQLGFAPIKASANTCAARDLESSAPCDERDAHNRWRRLGLVFDCIDHWRTPTERVCRLSARLWSFWSRSPHLFAEWRAGEMFLPWSVVHVCADADFVIVPPCSFRSAGNILAQARLWNERTQSVQSSALRLLLAARADHERGLHDRRQPYQLCGLPFVEVLRAMRTQDVSARDVFAADIAVISGGGTTHFFDTHSIRIERLAPRDTNNSGGDCRCLVLLLLGDYVATHAWATQDQASTYTALVDFSFPSGAAASPRLVVLWLRTTHTDNNGGCRDDRWSMPIGPCAPFEVYARMSRVGISSQFQRWVLDLETQLAICRGVVSRLDDHLRVSKQRQVNSELLAIEIDEVAAMIRACSSASDLLGARRRGNRWRLPLGTCGCGCQEGGVPTGSPCLFTDVPDVRDDETRAETQARNNAYWQQCEPYQLTRQACLSPTTGKEATIQHDSVVLTCGGTRHDLSDASMDTMLALLHQTGYLAHIAAPTW